MPIRYGYVRITLACELAISLPQAVCYVAGWGLARTSRLQLLDCRPLCVPACLPARLPRALLPLGGRLLQAEFVVPFMDFIRANFLG